jgi:dihydrofolate synthase/folylpolyglutamate synthase
MRFEKLSEWLAWQEQLHPNTIDMGLERISSVHQRLGNKPPARTVITVGGTNGKGSCVAMLEAIYLKAGYRVGAYTSPHLHHYTERIRINGEVVKEDTLCAAFDRVDQVRNEVSLSYFEFGTLAALDIFGDQSLDVAILEVGLGGRLDAVNIIDADLAVLASIGIDHQDWLGDDRETIAKEKAGIMRADCPAVCGDSNPPASLIEYADTIGAGLHYLGRDFFYHLKGDVWEWRGDGQRCFALPRPAMRGNYQLCNAATVLTGVMCLSDKLPVAQADVRSGLLAANLEGRFQVIPGEVVKVLDVAHNSDAAKSLASTLKEMPCVGTSHAVVAMLQDKDIKAVLTQLQPVVDRWYVAGLDVARGASETMLAGILNAMGATQAVYQFDTVAKAYNNARTAAVPGDRIVVFGSFYTVAQVVQVDI